MKEVNPKETTRAYAFELWMNAPHAHAHLFQDHRCYSSNPNKQTNKAKVQYVDVLVYRKSSKRHKRVLYASC